MWPLSGRKTQLVRAGLLTLLIGRLLLFSTLVWVFPGGAHPAYAKAASSGVTLRFSEYPRPFENEMLAELIPLFEKQNPDIKIV